MITKNKFVTVSYELRTEKDGELLETAGTDRPLEFICGQGQTLEYFELNLLESFVVQTSLSWWVFAGAGGIAFSVTLLTVSYLTFRAVRVKPVEVLKNE